MNGEGWHVVQLLAQVGEFVFKIVVRPDRDQARALVLVIDAARNADRLVH